MFCICAVARDEEDYLDEWIKHHLSIGFDFIVLYDNNDNNKQEEICKKYKDVLSVKIKYSKYLQFKAYNHFLKNFGSEFEYITFIDLDEFIVFNPDQPIQNIKDLVKHDYYHLSWKLMDDNDLVYQDNRPLLERFTREMKYYEYGQYDFPVNYHAKSLIKYNDKLVCGHPHYFACDYKCYNCKGEEVKGDSALMTPNYDVCYIKHFYTKTAEEYYKYKMPKARCDLGTKNYYDMSLFFKYNTFTEEKYRVLKGEQAAEQTVEQTTDNSEQGKHVQDKQCCEQCDQCCEQCDQCCEQCEHVQNKKCQCCEQDEHVQRGQS